MLSKSIYKNRNDNKVFETRKRGDNYFICKKTNKFINIHVDTSGNKDVKLLHKWVQSIKAVYPIISILHNVPTYHENMREYILLVTKLVENHGADFALKRLKDIKLLVQQVCLKQPISSIPFLKTDKEGFPSCFSRWKPNVSSLDSMRFSVSITRIPEVFTLPVKYDSTTIVNPSTAKAEELVEIEKFIDKWEGTKTLEPLKTSNIIMSNKAGPNGPATFSCLRDLNALRQAPKLYEAVSTMLKASVPFLDMTSYKTPSNDYKTSKLVLLQDKMGKTRIIAIADWWSNQALKPIHDSFMKALRVLPGDVTFCQDKVPHIISNMGDSLYSSDMTAFTDRFPIEILEMILKKVYGPEISSLWKTILTDRDFSHPEGDVRYNAGNPMGVLSSWAVSTFAHHAIKAYAYWKTYKSYNGHRRYKYIILGDDTLDSDKSVYNNYIQIIQNLGVSISQSKCTQSELGNAEFAKRTFTKQGEITGIPVTLLVELKNKPEQFLELNRILNERGYNENNNLARLIQNVIDYHFKDSFIPDLLALEIVENAAPQSQDINIFDEVNGVHSTLSEEISLFIKQDPSVQEQFLAIAKDYVFWKLTNKVVGDENQPPALNELTSVECFTPSHPLVFGLNNYIEAYLPEESYDSEGNENEYFIYEQWLLGEYHHLATLPDLDTYRFYNKGHKVTKCKFEIYKALRRLLRGDTSIALLPRVRKSNYELHEKCFERLQQIFLTKKRS